MVKTFTLSFAIDPAHEQEVICARVFSNGGENEGFLSLVQLKFLKEYAAIQGFAVVREYVNVETAKLTGRAAFCERDAHLKRPILPCA